MARIEIEDLTGTTTALAWPRDYANIKKTIKENGIFMCYGSLKIDEGEAPTVVIEEVENMEDISVERVLLKVDSAEEGQEVIEYIKNTDLAKGFTPIYLLYNGLQVLLSKEYWVNIPYIKDKYKDRVVTKVW